MVRTKLVPMCQPRTSRIPPWLMNRCQKRKTKRPFKIKLTLPEKKTVEIKKGGNVVKTITVGRKWHKHIGQHRSLLVNIVASEILQYEF